MADKEKENYEKDIFDLLEETNGENPNKKDMADRESVLPVEDEPQRGIPARGGSAQGGEETVLQLPIPTSRGKHSIATLSPILPILSENTA